MPNKRKTSNHKRTREIKISLTETEYQWIMEQANESGYPPSVFSRLAILGLIRRISPINLKAWNEVGQQLGHLDHITQLLAQIQAKSLLMPIAVIDVLNQELLKLRNACSSLVKNFSVRDEVDGTIAQEEANDP